MQLVPLNVTDGSPEITFQVFSFFANCSSCIFYEMDTWDTCLLILKYQREEKISSQYTVTGWCFSNHPPGIVVFLSVPEGVLTCQSKSDGWESNKAENCLQGKPAKCVMIMIPLQSWCATAGSGAQIKLKCQQSEWSLMLQNVKEKCVYFTFVKAKKIKNKINPLDIRILHKNVGKVIRE